MWKCSGFFPPLWQLTNIFGFISYSYLTPINFHTRDDWEARSQLAGTWYKQYLPEKNLVPFSKSRMLLYRLVISSCRSFMLFFLLAPDGELVEDMNTARSTSW